MPAIGYVVRDNGSDSFRGSLKTLSIDTKIEIVPNKDKTDERHPDFRVFTGAQTEIGAGWWRTGKASGKDYVSLTLAAPELGMRKLFANLGPAANQDDEDVFAIIWNPVS